MRAAIRQLLVAGVEAVGGRIYEPHVASATTVKPYLVLKEATQDAGAPWAAASTTIEVWPYIDTTTYQTVDSIAASVIDTLHRARFHVDGQQYLLDYQGAASQDFYDEEWQALTRALRFTCYALGWLDGQTYSPDPIAALRHWTRQRWRTPPDHGHTHAVLQTDPARWDPSDSRPGVYWRLTRVSIGQMTAALTWIDARITGHIIVPDPATRLTWVRRITEALATDKRISLSDGSPLMFGFVAADTDADPHTQGQIVLTARFGVLPTETKYEILRTATVSGDLDQEAVISG